MRTFFKTLTFLGGALTLVIPIVVLTDSLYSGIGTSLFVSALVLSPALLIAGIIGWSFSPKYSKRIMDSEATATANRTRITNVTINNRRQLAVNITFVTDSGESVEGVVKIAPHPYISALLMVQGIKIPVLYNSKTPKKVMINKDILEPVLEESYLEMMKERGVPDGQEHLERVRMMASPFSSVFGAAGSMDTIFNSIFGTNGGAAANNWQQQSQQPFGFGQAQNSQNTQQGYAGNQTQNFQGTQQTYTNTQQTPFGPAVYANKAGQTQQTAPQSNTAETFAQTQKQAAKAPVAKVDINNCTAEHLAGLPGISPEKAKQIVALRKERSGYTSFTEFFILNDLEPHFMRELENLVEVGAKHKFMEPESGRKVDI